MKISAGLEPADQAARPPPLGILRIADGLDRGHTAAVETVQTEITKSRLVVTAIPRFAGADLSLESHSAAELSDVLAKYLDKEIVIRTA